jgi:ATP phosphoribosyltransferase
MPPKKAKLPVPVPQLKFGFPKGSLQDSTFRLFQKAGYKVSVGSRAYIPSVDDSELSGLLIRSQEMARYVEDEVLDAGMCGRDWVLENNADVVEVCELKYSKQTNRPIRWVVAVPNDSPINSLKQLQGKRIATELVGYTERYLKKHGVKANVEFSWGATEVKPPVLADAIVELTETGSSLKANNLRILETILESVTVLIANKKAYQNPWKRKKIENIAMLLQGAILAEEKVGLKMNVPKKNLDEVLAKLPALNSPTISHLSNEEWVSLEVILDERTVRDIIPEIKRAGASGIVEYPLNKVIP